MINIRLVIEPSSARALKIKLWTFDDTRPMPRWLKTQLPFLEMKIGESFFMLNHETTQGGLNEAKEIAKRINKNYSLYFAIVKHKDKHEFARIA